MPAPVVIDHGGPATSGPFGSAYNPLPAPAPGTGGSPAADPSRFSAHCGAQDPIGAAVCITSSAIQVTRADCASSALVVGIIISKSSDTDCVVQTSGNVTVFTGLTPGATYFLGQAGALVAPPLPTSVVYVQQLGTAASADTLHFAPLATAYRRSP